MKKQVSKLDATRIAAEEDLYFFIKLVAPHRVLGSCHKDVLKWWTREDAKSHQMLLFPRDHQKSALVAYRCAWEITRNPAVTIFYLSSTANLAEKQLKFIKDILDSKIYRRYWPEMVHPDEGKREKWTVDEFSVDHPLRKQEGVRDPTVFTGGLTTGRTGMHCNIAVLDDVVVQENAYVREGRNKVKSQYSLLASIETTDAREWVVGTRYHPQDLYGELQEMVAELTDQTGNIVSQELIYETYQREVEDSGDGSGEFLWPRQQRPDGRWFGFNAQILAKKRGQYLDKTQFRAQYYNNPNDAENEAISSDFFQYYDRRLLEQKGSQWTYKGKPLNVYAAIDFAFSLSAKADFSALVVIGVDPEGNYYVLMVDRFKTNKILEYYQKIMEAHTEWGFRKLRAEVTVAQDAIVESLADTIRANGLVLSIDKFRPTRFMGVKEERMMAILQPRYENHSMWHYKGGLIDELEYELKSDRPAHDDIKDALANAVDLAVIPKHKKVRQAEANVVYSSRFGGVAYR